MSSSNPSSVFIVPPGQYPPFAIVSESDHTAWIILATAIGLSCILIFGAIRIFVRCTISPGAGLDDAFLAASTILTTVQSCVVLSACADGLGKSIELVPVGLQAKIQQMYYWSTLLFVIALAFSKLSVVFFLRRLSSSSQSHVRVFNTAAALVTAWMVGAIFAVTLQCDLAHPWIVIGERCSGTFLRWQIISALDIVFEIGLVGMAVLLVWDLHTSVSRKAVVVCAFGFRLGMIIPIAFRLSTFDTTGRSTNITLLETVFIVWTQTELNYSLIAATIPTLRPFVSNLNTQLGGLGNTDGYGYGTASSTIGKTNGSYQMSNLKSASRSKVEKEQTGDGPGDMCIGRSDTYSYDIQNTSTIVDVEDSNTGGKRNTVKLNRPKDDIIHGDATSVDSNDSQQMIIRKDVTYGVLQEAIP